MCYNIIVVNNAFTYFWTKFTHSSLQYSFGWIKLDTLHTRTRVYTFNKAVGTILCIQGCVCVQNTSKKHYIREEKNVLAFYTKVCFCFILIFMLVFWCISACSGLSYILNIFLYLVWSVFGCVSVFLSQCWAYCCYFVCVILDIIFLCYCLCYCFYFLC